MQNEDMIETNVIGNVGLGSRLIRVSYRHCVDSNERLYGRTVALARDWFMKKTNSDMSVDEQVAFVSRKGVAKWIEVFLNWTGWEKFVEDVMGCDTPSGVIKALVLRESRKSRNLFEDELRFVSKSWFNEKVWIRDEFFKKVRYGYYVVRRSLFDSEFYNFVMNAHGKPAGQVLMEADLNGFEWTWDMVQLLSFKREFFPILEMLFRCKIDAVAEFATPREIAKFTLSDDPPNGWWEGDFRVKMIASVAKKWPRVYDDLYGYLKVCESVRKRDIYDLGIRGEYLPGKELKKSA